MNMNMTALGSCPDQPWVQRPDPLRGGSRGPREPPEQIPAIVCVNLVSVVLSCKRLKESNVKTPSDRAFPPQNPTLLCGLHEDNSTCQYLSTKHISGQFNIHHVFVWLFSALSSFPVISIFIYGTHLVRTPGFSQYFLLSHQTSRCCII